MSNPYPPQGEPNPYAPSSTDRPNGAPQDYLDPTQPIPSSQPSAPTADPYAAPAQPYGSSIASYTPTSQASAPNPAPYGQSGYGQQGYGQQMQPAPYDAYSQGGYGQQPQSWSPQGGQPHPNAQLSMILGIVGLVQVPIVSFVAWYLANKGRREVRESGGRLVEDGNLKAGYVLGIIGSIMQLLWVAFIVFYIVIAIAVFAQQ